MKINTSRSSVYYPPSEAYKPEEARVSIFALPHLVNQVNEIISKVGKDAYRRIIIALIRSETSFRTRRWVDDGYAGIQTFSATPLADLENILPSQLIREASVGPKSSTGGRMVEFPHRHASEFYSPSSSAVASWIANRAARTLPAGTVLTKKTAYLHVAKAIAKWRGLSNLRGTVTDNTIRMDTGWSPAKQLERGKA